MCTAVDFASGGRYFGRNLDLEYSLGEEVVIMPRRFPLKFRYLGTLPEHCAIVGMALVKDGYPLYYDAVNEHGLAMAGLNFVGNAGFPSLGLLYDTVAQFELIPYILTGCKTLDEAKDALMRVNFSDVPFGEGLPPAELHYMISDGVRSLVAEPMEDKLYVYENPFGVLTNNPPFPFHRDNMSLYLNLTKQEAENRFSKGLPLKAFSRGMGAIGLPGDFSSVSRFVRAAFVKHSSVHCKDELSSVNQFFHILSSVSQPEGAVRVGENYERTQYSSCCNLNTGTYYYRTYGNSRINAVRLCDENTGGEELLRFPLKTNEDVLYEN